MSASVADGVSARTTAGAHSGASKAEDGGDVAAEMLLLQARAKEVDELNSKLRTQIRERHREIEELEAEWLAAKERAAKVGPATTLQVHLQKESERDALNASSGRAEMESQVSALEARLADLSARNAELQRQNKRLAGLLASGVVPTSGGSPSPLPPVTPRQIQLATSDSGSTSLPPLSPRPVQTSSASTSSPLKATVHSLLDVLGSLRKPPGGDKSINPVSPVVADKYHEQGGAAALSALSRLGKGHRASTSREPSKENSRMPWASPMLKDSTQVNPVTVAAAEACIALWRGQDLKGQDDDREVGLRGVLAELLEGAAKILRCDGRPAGQHVAMMYIMDDWLKRALDGMVKAVEQQKETAKGRSGRRKMKMFTMSAALAGAQRAKRRVATKTRHQLGRAVDSDYDGPFGPSVYYLAGKVTVHGYRRMKQQQPLPPAFSDLASLPLRTSSALVFPIQAGPGQPVLAVLQITGSGTLQAETGGRTENQGLLNVAEAQVTGLHLLCSMAVGIIDIHLRIGKAMALRGRARDALLFTSEINGSKDLTTFEQRAKLLAVEFFPNASSVLLSWYDPQRRELITTDTRPRKDAGSHGGDPGFPPAVGRRNIARVAVQDGIAAQCIRTKQVVRIKPSATQAPALVGPLVARLSNGKTEVVGVLHMICKTTPAGMNFSDEDELFFAELMNIIGLAARRTMRAQAYQERATEELAAGRTEPPSLERLLLMSEVVRATA